MLNHTILALLLAYQLSFAQLALSDLLPRELPSQTHSFNTSNNSLILNQKHQIAPIAPSTIQKREFAKNDLVLDLNSENFDQVTKDKNFIIKFYSPSCFACVRLEPIWIEAINEYAVKTTQASENKISFAAVDCIKNKQLCSGKNISAWPTLWAAYNGKQLAARIGAGKIDTILEFFEEAKTEFIKNSEKSLNVPKLQSDLTTTPPKIPDTNPTYTVLTNSNYSNKVKTGLWFIKFYSPTCGACVRIAPIWNNVVKNFSARFNASGMRFAEINCPENREACSKANIAGYPSLNFYSNGKLVEESHDFSESDLSKFAENMIAKYSSSQKNKVINPNSPKNKKLSQGKSPLILDIIDTEPQSPLADSNDDSHSSEDKKNGSDYASSENSEIIEYESNKNIYQDQSFINSEDLNIHGNLISLKANNFKKIIKNTISLIFFYKPGCNECPEILSELHKVSKSFQNQANICSVDCSKESSICKEFKITSTPKIKLVFNDMNFDYNLLETNEPNISDFLVQNRATATSINNIIRKTDLFDTVIDQYNFSLKKNHFYYLYVDSSVFENAEKNYILNRFNPKSILQRLKLASVASFSSRRFFVVKDPKLGLEIGAKVLGKKNLSENDLKTPILVMYNNNEFTKYSGDIKNIKEITKWFYDNNKMLYKIKAKELENENSQKLLTEYDYLVLGVTKSDSDTKTQDLKTALVEANADFKLYFSNDLAFSDKHIEFAYIDGLKYQEYVRRIFEISQDSLPLFVILEPKLDNYYTITNKYKQSSASKITKTDILYAIQSAVIKDNSKKSMFLEKHNTAGALKNSAKLASRIGNKVKLSVRDPTIKIVLILFAFTALIYFIWICYKRKSQHGSYLPVHKSQ
ncbi:hypothetical protein BB561_000356 [Smittium simulii]|uniref:Thioredoxin domain-containing protein n=1 Tax=Smittium simulii TaxID=133385 RepID=A0A2T9YZI0_9FUNG|nr:hypothetical protein BB561_000356 [Smittium simulii]